MKNPDTNLKKKKCNFSAVSFFYPVAKKYFWFKMTYFRLNRAARNAEAVFFQERVKARCL